MTSECDQHFRLFELIRLTEDEKDQVLESINYSTAQLSMDLAVFRQWVREQEHLPPSRLAESDDFFTSFLIGCKGSLETAKRKLDKYYTLRRTTSFLSDRSPSCFLHNFDQTIQIVMPQTFQGYRMGYLKLLTSDGLDLEALVRRVFFAAEVAYRTPGIIAGDCLIIDCELVTVSITSALSPSVFKDLTALLTGAMPNRCLQYYFINCSALIENVVNRIIRPLMSKKLAERFTVTREGGSFLRASFPPQVIPAEYGGEGPSMKSLQEHARNVLTANEGEGKEEFLNRLRELTDESKRPIKLSDENDSVFGVQGSIKNLNID